MCACVDLFLGQVVFPYLQIMDLPLAVRLRLRVLVRALEQAVNGAFSGRGSGGDGIVNPQGKPSCTIIALLHLAGMIILYLCWIDILVLIPRYFL